MFYNRCSSTLYHLCNLPTNIWTSQVCPGFYTFSTLRHFAVCFSKLSTCIFEVPRSGLRAEPGSHRKELRRTDREDLREDSLRFCAFASWSSRQVAKLGQKKFPTEIQLSQLSGLCETWLFASRITPKVFAKKLRQLRALASSEFTGLVSQITIRIIRIRIYSCHVEMSIVLFFFFRKSKEFGVPLRAQGRATHHSSGSRGRGHGGLEKGNAQNAQTNEMNQMSEGKFHKVSSFASCDKDNCSVCCLLVSNIFWNVFGFL